MDAMMGVKNSAMKNQKEQVSAVRPVRPPSRMPVADSVHHACVVTCEGGAVGRVVQVQVQVC
jgi:hypothetical protein